MKKKSFLVPNECFQAPIDPSAFKLLLFIYCKYNEGFSLKRNEITKQIGLSQSRVAICFKRLVNNNIVKCIKFDDREPIYYLNDREEWGL